ncbi:hypothetical protein LJY25_08325 [Hymenobacter sp. BT175]|uniref:hypothetical protein n=1 Tax=Hymenobacter translucens TaxID=2886507 RepID=UPI001D0F373F|nr:hypothetical protein [Hymenobacter translucens]MCC2546447.1 hypothetical protein [Hymenobacter translucens]
MAASKGLKPSDIASSIDVSVNYVYKLYKSEHLNTELLQKLSAALEIPLVDFFKEESASISQSGTGNIQQTGSRNKQKIMPGAKSTGHTTSATDTEELATKLADCEKDKTSLARELEVTRELVKAKDEMILLLKGSRTNPN